MAWDVGQVREAWTDVGKNAVVRGARAWEEVTSFPRFRFRSTDLGVAGPRPRRAPPHVSAHRSARARTCLHTELRPIAVRMPRLTYLRHPQWSGKRDRQPDIAYQDHTTYPIDVRFSPTRHKIL